jgi:hypothetical protein
MTAPSLDGSVDLAWLVKAEPWQLRMAAAMLRPYFLVTAAILDLRADRLEVQPPIPKCTTARQH